MGDAEPPSSAGAAPSEALASGQRSLAAIVFTDTVGFSKLMSKDEEQALRLVARDLDRMKTICGSFGGKVLKSTGDGLLMLFTSAVQAVACALEIQRDFQKQNVELLPTEQLQHRIGIHLGDVFQHGGDVMGDGVNIAARLQTEAVPGGICLSKTVYDVVNNRLQFYVNDLGARKLKNIGMVTAYQISPTQPGTGNRMPWYRWRPWLWRGAALLTVLIIVGLAFELGEWYRHRMYVRSHPVAAVSPAKSTPAPVPTFAPATTSPTTSNVPAIAPSSANPAPGNVMEVSQTAFEDATFRFMTSYDYAGMENWIKQHDWPSKPTNTLAQACPQLDDLISWTQQQLQTYTFEKPLKVGSPEHTSFYWPAAFGGLNVKIVQNQASPPANTKYLTWGADKIPPMAMVGIIQHLLNEKKMTPPDLKMKLKKELNLFIRTYHIVLPKRNPTNTPAPVAPPG